MKSATGSSWFACTRVATSFVLAVLLGACGGGSPSTPVPVTTSNPVQQMAVALRGSITRDPTQWPNANEDYLLTQREVTLFVSLPPPASQYDRDVEHLKTAANIATVVPVRATTDLMCVVQYGGGVTGHSAVFLDGKFFDILLDYASYLTMAERGAPVDVRAVALAKIVTYHNGLRCANFPISAFLYASNPQIGSSSATVEKFDSMAGAILYHEYGHYWTWATLDQLRIQNMYLTFGSTPYALYPAKSEDEADTVAGILTKKAGHDLQLAMEMMDIMALYTYNRAAGMYPDINNIESFQAQIERSTPQYSSLITRKSLLRAGYNAYR